MSGICWAQTGIEIGAPDYIKSIVFSDAQGNNQFPIVRLGETIQLAFDDLQGTSADYYYKIKHFNADWSPSQLFSNEVFSGYDDIRITDFQNSFNTLQPYTHYSLSLPNADTQFLVSGNYLLEIYNAVNDLVFSRRFCLFEDKASVGLGVFRPQNIDRFTTHQSLHFSITPYGSPFRNPEERIKVVLLQNYQWDQTIENLKPQYYSGNTLEYRYEAPAQFEGGNEYLFFDTKDLRMGTANISSLNRAEVYETYLYTDLSRKYMNYTLAPDINGDFLIRTLMGTQDPAVEADYSFVYFSLAEQYDLKDSEIYLYGKFNNYALTEENRMYYNPSLELFEGVLLLKQGFYNYKYIVVDQEGLQKNAISGTHAATENSYTALVYYRDNGALYDALVGVGQAQSFELRN